MYNATKWLDKVVDVDSGEVIQAGTDQSAAHFNNMESGITDASVAAAMLLIAAGELQSQTEIERHVVELKNTASYPFNNSAKTVSLAITRDKEEKQRREAQDKREKLHEQQELFLVQGVNAAIALGEATARAVQRIPDANCNSDMHAALDYAAKVKHDQKDFLTRQGIESIYES